MTNKCNLCWSIVSSFSCMQTCRMIADVCSVCTIGIATELFLTVSKHKPGYGQAPDVCKCSLQNVNTKDTNFVLNSDDTTIEVTVFTLPYVITSGLCSILLDLHLNLSYWIFIRHTASSIENQAKLCFRTLYLQLTTIYKWRHMSMWELTHAVQ